ncbi:MAG: hypothetical protein MI806_11920, partial [Minwuiales bacterium]|nr:hypothetical protein [Minwuiales bacterium]
MVLIDGRLRVRRRGDGRLQDHTAGPGTVWLCPAGIPEDMIRLDGEISESVHIYIPAAPLSASALEEFDIDPANTRLRYDGGFRDPVIEQIGRSVLAELKEPGPGGGLLVETMGAALGAYLLRHYSNRSVAATPLPRAEGALDRRRLNRITEYITDNLQRNLSFREPDPLGELVQGNLRVPLERGQDAAVDRIEHGSPNSRYMRTTFLILRDIAGKWGNFSENPMLASSRLVTGERVDDRDDF